MKTRKTTAAVFASLAVAGLLLGACSSDSDSSSDSAAETTTTEAMAAEETTIVSAAADNPDFSILVGAVETAGLVETLSGEGPYTVFAPTNEAFEALPAGTLEGLTPEQLGEILTYHVIEGEVMAADVVPGAVTTVNGEDITIAVDGSAVTITDAMGNTVNVTATDIVTDNGVIHVIDGVLMP
jgi:uncharacterized surface protein with fasciclin (FAS1) repeats